MEIASYLVRPGDFRPVLGSPPSRCSTTSVVRLSAPTLLTPATYRPSHLTRNLKFLYGSSRCTLTLNCIVTPLILPLGLALTLGLDLSRDLLDLQDDELGRLERREADEDIDDAAVDVVLGSGRPVAADEVGLGRR